VDLQAEEARAARLVAGALAGLGQDRPEQRPGRAQRYPGQQGRDRGRDRYRPDGREGARAEAGDLAVPEPAPVCPFQQGVAAADHPGIEAGHEERPGPLAKIGVVAGPGQLALVAERGLRVALRAERVGVGDDRAVAGAGAHVVDLPHAGRQGAAADPAPQCRHHQRGVLKVSRAVGAGRVMGQQDREVGGDGVEPAAVHDAGPGADGRLVAAAHGVPDEQHLAGEVRVIGPGLGARTRERQAEPAVRADGRHDHARRPGKHLRVPRVR